MIIKSSALALITAVILAGTPSFAATKCDDKPKPAIGCPPGYEVMCIPVGGPHWGCGKEVNGQIIAADPVGVKGSVGAAAQVQAGVSVEAGAVKAVVETGTSASAEAGNRAETNSSQPDGKKEAQGETLAPTATIELNADMNAGVQVRGWDAKEKKEVTVSRSEARSKVRESMAVTAAVDPASITSVDDLEAFAAALIESDGNIALIKLAPDKSLIDYRISGKLFGVIPVRTLAHVWCEPDGRVKVKFPWYAVFVKKLSSLSEAELQNEAQATLTLTASEAVVVRQAAALKTVSNVLKTRHDTSLSAVQNVR